MRLRSDGVVHCSVQMLLFNVKNFVKVSRNFGVARLKEKEKKNTDSGSLATFWFITFLTGFFHDIESLLGQVNTRK